MIKVIKGRSRRKRVVMRRKRFDLSDEEEAI